MTDAHEATQAREGPRWDPIVRLTHWGVAAAVLLNGLVTEEGGAIHVWIGWAAFGLLALRLVWGAVGTEPARFSSFPPSLSAARTHVQDMVAGRHRAHRSHNPLGALMAYALWAALAAVTATGIAMAGSPFSPRMEEAAEAERPAVVAEAAEGHEARGSDAGEHDDDAHGAGEDEENEVLEEIHEAAGNVLLLLAALHVGGVALESRLSRRDLVRPMVKGS